MSHRSSSIARCAQKQFYREALLKFSQDLQENTCARVPFLIKLETSAYNFIKKRLCQRNLETGEEKRQF